MSSGYLYGEDEPTTECPYCQTICRADFVDNGVCLQQCGPYHCEQCGASEIGPNDAERGLFPDEQRTNWYVPGSMPGSSANVIGGKVVGHIQMQKTYKHEFKGNMLWHDKAYVADWWDQIRN